MSLYSSYNTQLEYYLADQSEAFFESAMKVSAVNEAIEVLLEDYDVPEFIKRATITFDSSGIGSVPSDYFRMIKIWDADSDGVEENEYQYITPDAFDAKSSSDSYYWTEDYVVASAARKLKCLPTDSGTLQVRYVKKHTAVDSSDVNDSGLDSRWTKVIAAGAAKILLENAGQMQEAVLMDQQFKTKASRVYMALKNRGGWKQGLRLKSKWERQSLLNRK